MYQMALNKRPHVKPLKTLGTKSQQKAKPQADTKKQKQTLKFKEPSINPQQNTLEEQKQDQNDQLS